MRITVCTRQNHDKFKKIVKKIIAPSKSHNPFSIIDYYKKLPSAMTMMQNRISQYNEVPWYHQDMMLIFIEFPSISYKLYT